LGTNSSYVIGRGEGNKIKDILDIVFEYLDIDWNPHVKVNNNLLRTNSPISIISNPRKIYEEFNWTAQTSFRDMILKLLNFKLTS
jgi:GDPmannose 4,6-dehydratase